MIVLEEQEDFVAASRRPDRKGVLYWTVFKQTFVCDGVIDMTVSGITCMGLFNSYSS